MDAHAEYADGLRKLADWIEAHPEAELPPAEITIYPVETKENAAAALRAMSPCQKHYTDELFEISRDFGAIRLRYLFYRKTVCVPVVIGKRKVEAKVIPEKVIPRQEIAEHEEEIIEWKCAPILAAQPEQEAA